jgi:cytochrome c553
MEYSKMLMHKTIILTVGFSLTALFTGCSLFETKTASEKAQAATEDMAYYTCAGCHGPRNQRVWMMSPNILGQKKGYLVAKLKDFRDGKRVHPFMNGVTEDLSDQEITDLAAYYANYSQAAK